MIVSVEKNQIAFRIGEVKTPPVPSPLHSIPSGDITYPFDFITIMTKREPSRHIKTDDKYLAKKYQFS